VSARTRFLPGSVLQERYRIVNLLGGGGMGEVYRADDLKLGQAVALKFVRPSPHAEAEKRQRERMLTEVRLARRVTDPYVCRVYDVGELDGLPFVTMEYVDGEDLASLLRRIGRLPGDKAEQVALELCAGLAAAHDQGILHRDLKPADVMIDGRGRARITDFGLAALAGEVWSGDALVGTRGYMAPELLGGAPASIRSDLYALGLVLHQVFTGRVPVSRPIAGADTLSESSPDSRASLFQGLDPDVERVVLRCLETDPEDRPSSAHAVAAALPGGDPVAAALARGEMPSPQMVAAGGAVGGLSRAAAGASLAVLLVGLGADLSLSDRGPALLRAALQRPPAVLRDRTDEMLAELGQTDVARDSELGLDYDRGALDYLTKAPSVAADPDSPPAVYYWYRRSPELLVSDFPSAPSFTNPPGVVPGMTSVRLAPDGRLLELIVTGRHEQPASAAPLDWRVPFAWARLEPAEFEPAPSSSIPSILVDEHRSWTRSPDRGRIPLRVEAAGFHGRLVYFRLQGPWSRPLGREGPSVRWWYV
jgi:serine/threonine-protein kinase